MPNCIRAESCPPDILSLSPVVDAACRRRRHSEWPSGSRNLACAVANACVAGAVAASLSNPGFERLGSHLAGQNENCAGTGAQACAGKRSLPSFLMVPAPIARISLAWRHVERLLPGSISNVPSRAPTF
jgi:hypothetical protein